MASSDKLSSQTYLIDVKPDAKAYRYSVKIETVPLDERKTPYVISSDGREMAAILKLEKLQACKSAMDYAFQEGGFDNDAAYIYDGASSLVSSKELKVTEVVIRSRDMPQNVKFITRRNDLRITLEEQRSNFEIEYGQLERLVNLESNDNEKTTILSFMESLIFAPFTNGRVGYSTQLGSGKNLIRLTPDKENSLRCGDGRCIVPGINRSIMILNYKKKPSFAVSVDFSQNIYYEAGNLAEIVLKICKSNKIIDRDRLESGINSTNILGVLLKTNHRSNGEIFKLKANFSENGASREMLINGNTGNSESVQDYFRRRYNIELRYPEMPCLIHTIRKKIKIEGEEKTKIEEVKNYYPLEVLDIIPGQHVPVSKMDSNSASVQQRINTKGPKDRKQNCYNEMMLMGMFDAVPIFDAFNIKLNPNHVFFQKEQLEDVAFQTATRTLKLTRLGKINYNKENVSTPATVEKYLVIAYGKNFENYIRTFTDEYTNCCRINGIQFREQPVIVSLNDRIFSNPDENPGEFAEKMNRFIKTPLPQTFLVYIDSKKIRSHLALKFYEQRYMILTQHITEELANKLHSRPESMRNVVNKTNDKLGGLNFKVQFGQNSQNINSEFNPNSKETLYIGLDLNTSPSIGVRANSEVYVAAWSANVSKVPGQYLTDYWYQLKTIDNAMLFDHDPWENEMKKLIKKWKKNVSSKAPKRIVVFRSGLSRGAFNLSKEIEIPLLEEFISEYFECDIPLCYIFVNRTSNIRIYDIERNGVVKNVEAGTYVSDGLSVGDNIQMIGKSYANCLGTAKLPMYTIAYDSGENKLSKKQLMDITNMLCYTYDIIPSAVSIPAVVYIAIETSKRGSNNLIAHSNNHENLDLDNCNRSLNYTNSLLNDLRFNA
uniref:PAZ domain-containing protein n=1 Tax=Parastrongyloides trichosuri TaxID=131310 RepID=A0A0N4ZMQ3_PARTI